MKAKTHSAKLYAFQKPNKAGDIGLYLAVTMSRKTKYISLKLFWPGAYFDFVNQQILKRASRDKGYSDTMMVINQHINKCNEIFVNFRLRDVDLEMETFLHEYYNFNLKKDFKIYFESKITARYKRDGISVTTKKNHTNTLNKLKAFHTGELPFEKVTVKWCREFESHLSKKLSLAKNTVWSHMKDINTYLNMAKEEDNIPCANPFQNGYAYSAADRDIEALTKEELKELHDYYASFKIPDNEKEVLGQFLFSCYTGLRISDLKVISTENIVGNSLVFQPVKSRRFSKIQRVPLTKPALKFLKGIEGVIFPSHTDQSCNRMLKKIQAAKNIKKKMTNHLGRHSFATLFLELGGSVEVLQKILGHSKISTTMVYVHITEKRKEEQMSNFDSLDF